VGVKINPADQKALAANKTVVENWARKEVAASKPAKGNSPHLKQTERSSIGTLWFESVGSTIISHFKNEHSHFVLNW